MRLIDVDALIAEYDRVHVGEPGGARKLMMDAPTVEERKTGKWIPLISTSDEKHHEWCGYQCSICGERTLRLMQHNYCPFCGADMRGEQND